MRFLPIGPALALACLIPVASASAQTTLRDLVTLQAAGVTDDILVALIESDDSVFRLTASDILDVRRQGLSDRVILAMIATTRKARPAGPQPPGVARDRVAPPVAEVPEAPPALERAPATTEPVAPPVERGIGAIAEGVDIRAEPRPEPPVTVHVTQHVVQRVEVPSTRTEYVHVPVVIGPLVRPHATGSPRQDRGASTERWGWGGQAAPGTWETRATTSPGATVRPAPKPESTADARTEEKPAPVRNGRGRGGGW